MKLYCEYATVSEVRQSYMSSNVPADDLLIRTFIRQASKEIDDIAGGSFSPIVKIRYYDLPEGTDLHLDHGLSELFYAVNGNGDKFYPSSLLMYPLNENVTRMLKLPVSSGSWVSSSISYQFKAIGVYGIWTNARGVDVGWTAISSITDDMSNADLMFEVANNCFSVGQIIRIENELMYVKSITDPVEADEDADPVVVGNDNYVIEVERAINGSEAVAHSTGLDIQLWNPGAEINMLTTVAAVAYYNLKSNPLANTLVMDGITFETPKDVSDYIRNKLSKLRMLKIGFA